MVCEPVADGAAQVRSPVHTYACIIWRACVYEALEDAKEFLTNYCDMLLDNI